MSEQHEHIPGGVVRITEIVGSSPNSFSDAVRNAVKAAETVRGIRGVEVISSNADVDENGNLSLYKVHCKIAFLWSDRGRKGRGSDKTTGRTLRRWLSGSWAAWSPPDPGAMTSDAHGAEPRGLLRSPCRRPDRALVPMVTRRRSVATRLTSDAPVEDGHDQVASREIGRQRGPPLHTSHGREWPS